MPPESAEYINSRLALGRELKGEADQCEVNPDEWAEAAICRGKLDDKPGRLKRLLAQPARAKHLPVGQLVEILRPLDAHSRLADLLRRSDVEKYYDQGTLGAGKPLKLHRERVIDPTFEYSRLFAEAFYRHFHAVTLTLPKLNGRKPPQARFHAHLGAETIFVVAGPPLDFAVYYMDERLAPQPLTVTVAEGQFVTIPALVYHRVTRYDPALNEDTVTLLVIHNEGGIDSPFAESETEDERKTSAETSAVLLSEDALMSEDGQATEELQDAVITFGLHLRRAMRAKGIASISDLATYLGPPYTDSRVRHLLEDRAPTVEELWHLARMLNLNLDDIFLPQSTIPSLLKPISLDGIPANVPDSLWPIPTARFTLADGQSKSLVVNSDLLFLTATGRGSFTVEIPCGEKQGGRHPKEGGELPENSLLYVSGQATTVEFETRTKGGMTLICFMPFLDDTPSAP